MWARCGRSCRQPHMHARYFAAHLLHQHVLLRHLLLQQTTTSCRGFLVNPVITAHCQPSTSILHAELRSCVAEMWPCCCNNTGVTKAGNLLEHMGRNQAYIHMCVAISKAGCKQGCILQATFAELYTNYNSGCMYNCSCTMISEQALASC